MLSSKALCIRVNCPMLVCLYNIIYRRIQQKTGTELQRFFITNFRLFQTIPPGTVRLFIELSEKPSTRYHILIEYKYIKSLLSTRDRCFETGWSCTNNNYLIHLPTSNLLP